MERRRWLAERRAFAEAMYDAEAPTYDSHDPMPGSVHRRFVGRLLETCPPGGIVLDAPCGTGKYFGLVKQSGRAVVGADQSAGMLAVAHSRHPDVRLVKAGLQELDFVHEFDAVMCIDSIEHVGPEDWPGVIANLDRSVRPGGYLYLTIEEVADAEHDRALAAAIGRGLPAVRGEHVEEGTAGYHYYPSRAQVARWLADEGLVVVEEGSSPEDGWSYWHLLLRSRRADSARPAPPRSRAAVQTFS